jgi:hypothetical protein
MASAILYNPLPTRIFEADGDFASGAKAYFYLARTTTPLTVYTDAPLTSAHTWPVIADAYGLLPPIYLRKGDEYKVRIEDALGSILYTADGIENPPEATAEGGSGLVVTADQLFQTGYFNWQPVSSVRDGWVRCNGRTISKLAGPGTEESADDCEALFAFLWNNFSDSICPVTPGGRGANAQADWDSAKAIATLDMRGRGIVGLDDMGNTAAGVIQKVTTATTTSASSTLFPVDDTTGICFGMYVICANVPAGTQVWAVSSATGIVMSAAATISGSDVPVRFSIFPDAQLPGSLGGENTHVQSLPEMAIHTHEPNGGITGFLYGDTTNNMAGGSDYGVHGNVGLQYVGGSVASNLQTPVRLGSWFCKK